MPRSWMPDFRRLSVPRHLDEGENLILPHGGLAWAYCTEGEIVNALREVFGEYTETPRF